MLHEELPHHRAGIDLACCPRNEPFRQNLAAGSPVSSAFNGIQNHVGILSDRNFRLPRFYTPVFVDQGQTSVTFPTLCKHRFPVR
jgi:hypothetical protein